MTIMKNKGGLLFYAFTFVFFITPNLPMPTSAQGPLGPGLYILIIGLFLILGRNYKSNLVDNRYFGIIMLLSSILLFSDILKALMFEPSYELKFIFIRVLNFALFFLFGQLMISKSKSEEAFVISPFYLKVYYYSVLFLAFILYGQATGFITFGEVYPARTYFGIKLPFNKPVGLLELSDGKLGIIIAPIILLAMINTKKDFRFFKIRWPRIVAMVLLLLIIILQSRSAYLGFVIAFFVFVLLYPSRRFRLYTLGFTAISGTLVLISGLYSFIWAGLVGEGIYSGNVEARAHDLSFAINNFLESPILGVGHKNTLYFASPLDTTGLGSHNLFLDHLASGGLLAFVPLVLLFVVFFYYTGKYYLLALRKKLNNHIGLSIWLITSMIYILVELSFYRGFYNEYTYLFLAFGLISYLNFTKIKNEENAAYS